MTKLNISTSYYNYDIYVGNNIDLNKYFTPYINKKLFIITDSNLYKIYYDYLKEKFKNYNYEIIVFKEGEKSKSFQVYQDIIASLLKKGMTKKDLIVSFGGGVTGDLSGFIAGTIFRGVKFINIPTSLLAMSDSSIGGKTGIDTSYGKNLIGVYKQPEFVIIDTFYLKTLAKEEYSNGMAEIIKAALIGSKNLVSYLLTKTPDINKVILKALKVKKRIVEKDPFEQNIRMFLNFGHTFAHAIEQYYNYEIKHGYAVALGMDLAIRYGVLNKLTNKSIISLLKRLYKKYQLNTFDGDADKYINNIKYDKKNFGDHLNFVIIKEVEEPKIIKIQKEDLYGLSS